MAGYVLLKYIVVLIIREASVTKVYIHTCRYNWHPRSFHSIEIEYYSYTLKVIHIHVHVHTLYIHVIVEAYK